MSAKDAVQAVAQSPKVAAIISAATTGTGISTFFDWLPSDIGKLGALIGIGLSIVLIRSHILEIKIKQNKLEIQEHEIARLREKDSEA